MDTGPTPKLHDLTNAYRLGGASALFQYDGVALLVHCGAENDSEASAFQTEAVVAPWATTVAVAAARGGHHLDYDYDRLMRASTVHAIRKREGGPFPDRIGVGRTRTADIALRFPSVSKYHAYFTEEKPGEELTLWDAKARNGTYANGEQIMPGQGTPLPTGCHVRFGREDFLFFTHSGFLNLLRELASDTQR